MGMLMHHTWQEQQKTNNKDEKNPNVRVSEETAEENSEPARKTAGRRKTK